MALMCFHASRSDSRLTSEGELILLPDQNRALYDARLIDQGSAFMDKAASGESISAYHLEAFIAFEHCTAASFEATNWPLILQYYEWLCKLAPNPMAELNRIIVLLQVQGPVEALREIEALVSRGNAERTSWEKVPLFHGLTGEIQARLGATAKAKAAF